MRLLMAAVGLIFLSGCAADYALIKSENVDSTYNKRTLRWSGTFGGTTTTYYIKAFRKDGMIALCGVRIMEAAAVADDLAGTWIERAQVYLGSRENTVASGRFIGEVLEGTPLDQITARCIKTKTPATDSTLFYPIGLVGDPVEIFY